jgi:hypothetical protein
MSKTGKWHHWTQIADQLNSIFKLFFFILFFYKSKSLNAKIGSAITKRNWDYVLPATIDLALWSLPAALGAKLMSWAQKRLGLAIRSQMTRHYQTVTTF